MFVAFISEEVKTAIFNMHSSSFGYFKTVFKNTHKRLKLLIILNVYLFPLLHTRIKRYGARNRWLAL